MFPASNSFLNDELKSELGMKTKKEEEESDDAMLIHQVRLAHKYPISP
jgi:hypothetical protein